MSPPPGMAEDVSIFTSIHICPRYAPQIAALIAVPEPTSLAFGAFAAAGAAVGYVRSRRRPKAE